MSERPTLILDAMGAELGTPEMVRGAALACAELGDRPHNIAVVAADPSRAEELFHEECASLGVKHGYFTAHQATQELPKEIKSPVEVYKKYPDCSVRVAMDLAREIPHSAVISPATTGLVMTAALFTLGRVKGIERPPIGTPMPTHGKQLFFVDGGSNVDCRPGHLYQFAVLASLYVQNVKKVDRPTIALLSNGSEDYKGNNLVREAAQMLEADKDLNFVGFTEGHTMFRGDLDIMVCDGFIGNILLKFAEGAAEMIVDYLKTEIKRSWLASLAAKFLQRAAFKRFASRLDYRVFGGAPLLGLNGNVVICHGRSPAVAIKNALKVGYEMAVTDSSSQVAQYIEAHPIVQIKKNGNGK